MAIEIDRIPENRPNYPYFVHSATNRGDLRYYVPAVLKRNFNFPIEFKVGADEEGKGFIKPRSYDVMTDGSATARKIEDIEQDVQMIPAARLIDDALAGQVRRVAGAAKHIFRVEQYEIPSNSPKPVLESTDIYRAFTLSFDRKYRESSRDRNKFFMRVIDDEEMRHFYNTLVGDFNASPMDDGRVMQILSGVVQDILNANPRYGFIQRPRG